MNDPAEGHHTATSCIYGIGADSLPYLACGLFPKARRIPLAVGQDAAAILAQVGPEVRWFVWHTYFTFKDNIPRDRAVLSQKLRQRGIHSINEGVTDVSKRHTQAVLSQLDLPTTIAAPEGDPDELLFFKSNHNFGGIPEKRLSQDLLDFFGIARPHPSTPDFSDYRVAKRREFPRENFENEDLFFERFVANEGNLFYRAFVVFDAVVLSKLECKGVIKKALEAHRRDDYLLSFSDVETGFSSAPDALSRRIMADLERFCRALKLDLGGVDVLLDDQGVPHVIDANPTPFGGPNLDRPGFLEHLLKGLQDHADLTESRTT